MAGAMDDFARMPTQQKVLLFIAAGALLGVVYWKLVYTSLGERLAAAEADHTNKVATNQKLTDDIPKFEALRARMIQLREENEKNQAELPSEAEVPAFFETLQRKVNESGVEIHKWSKKPEEPVETFFKVPVEVEMTGTFMQIKRFFASLIQPDDTPGSPEDRARKGERLVSIEGLALSSPTVRNREIVLTARFTAVTFREEDRPTPSDKAAVPGAPGGSPAAPAGRPTAPTVPPPATAAPPPLPSADTPAGAKARVEDSLQKGDAKNRGAAGAGDAKPAAGSDRLKGGL